MAKRVAVVIPVYKREPEPWEQVTLRKVREKFETTDIYLVMPQSLASDGYQQYGFREQRFPDRFFRSERTYTRLLLKPFFYQAFQEYEYMLIVQTDVWLLKGETALLPFVEEGVDYIGAPWPEGKTIYQYTFHGIGYVPKGISCPEVCYVGNGGLSLRRVQGVLDLLRSYRFLALLWKRSGEDTFFAYFGSRDKNFRIADISLASRFALETDAAEQLQKGIRPIGIHAWQKFVPQIKEWDQRMYE